jgi:L-lactate dehydrogenase complex protein LldE
LLISLFIACYNDTLFPETGKAVVTVLERLGHQVEFREAQTCCGQMHFNTGYPADAQVLMRRMLEVFRGAGIICVPSASCVAMMRDHYPKLAAASGEAELPGQVEDFLGRVFEFSELLVDRLGVTDVGASFPHRVTLHTSCHSLRSLHLTGQPVQLLSAVRGLEFVPLPRNDECCGFGGTFAVKNADVSTAMGIEKVEAIAATSADVCVAGDNSCLMHIGGLMHRNGVPVRCMHLAEILAAVELRQAEGRPEPAPGTPAGGSHATPVASGVSRKTA